MAFGVTYVDGGEAFVDDFIFEMGRAQSRELGVALKKISEIEKVCT